MMDSFLEATPIYFGSLFAGIGGIDLGLERAGMTCAWQVEIDPYCLKVLEKHWPDVPKHGDIRDIKTLPYVDLIAGGFPCPPVSLAAAGKRQFEDDPRWLWPEFYRIICEVKPEWVLAENVPGLLSARDGRLFAGILRDLADVGYCVEWESIPACAFGAPHIRYRTFILAHSEYVGWEKRPDVFSGSRDGRTSNLFDNAGKTSEIMANTSRAGQLREKQLENNNQSERRGRGFNTNKKGEISGEIPHPSEQRLEGRWEGLLGQSSWWSVEPDVGRVAHGVPSRVDRLRALGNAVVPQVAEWIGERIMEYELSQRR